MLLIRFLLSKGKPWPTGHPVNTAYMPLAAEIKGKKGI